MYGTDIDVDITNNGSEEDAGPLKIWMKIAALCPP